MRRLKRGDVVEFIQNYKDVVKKGETHLIDKAMYIDGVLQCVYIKGETNYIYFDGGDFEWYCKPYENKNVECKVVYLNAKKQMEKKINIGSRVLGLNLNGLDLSDEYGTVERIKDGFVTVQFSDNLVSFPEEELLKRNEESMKHITNFLNKIPNYSSIEEKKEYDYINPNHYKQGSKEVIEMMQDIWGKEKLIAYCEMNAFKYRMKAGLKPEQPIQRDLDKAKWYENKAIQLRNEQK